MPRPATVQAAIPTATLTRYDKINVRPPIPATMIDSPIRTSRRPSHLVFILAWIHDPVVQASVAPVTASPATTGLWWRKIVIVNVTNASAPKNANVSSDRLSIVAGSPYLAVSVPSGRSRRSNGTPTSRPATTSATPPSTGNACAPWPEPAVPLTPPTAPPDPAPTVSPPRTSPAAAATPTPSISRCPAFPGVAGRPSLTRAGSANGAVIAMNGSRPRNTHRQPNNFATSALTAGPTRPGTTQAVANIAIIRARSFSGRLRPIAT